jgi:hypothetical protein
MLQPKIVDVKPLVDYQLQLTFDTGETKIFDTSPYIKGSWFGELCDPAYFRSVHIVDEGYGISWANGQDIAPHELYEMSRLALCQV